MENVTYKAEGSTLTIALQGHIDSANAAEVEKEINAIREQNPADALVIDCDELNYISSAGLRIILRLKKAVADTVLVNVASEVYEVFDMTGFTEMMDIRRAYRLISVEGCEVIGQGANGRVYRIDPDTIVKVYLNPDALPEIHRERELARAAFVLGIPTAIPYDVVRIAGGGYGSVFELLNATSFAKLLIREEKSLDEVAKLSVDLLKLIHSTVIKPGTMPDMKAVALDWSEFLADYLPADQYEKLHSLIAAVPDDQHMMHGDYHIKNVMLQNGETLLIDMDTLCHGHPVFELASMFNAYRGYSETDHAIVKDFLGISYEIAGEFWDKSLHLYLDGADEETVRAVEDKARVVGYTRIMRRTIRRNGLNTEDGRKVIENCRTHLADLLGRVDTLTF
ncbi:MAG: anti-sigma factor antagonist [Oscillospiraceae bacterium]|nr:anti-sigma factor antagonist [Oscillospiraceae bacterium]